MGGLYFNKSLSYTYRFWQLPSFCTLTAKRGPLSFLLRFLQKIS